jgi:hypothetical protein
MPLILRSVSKSLVFIRALVVLCVAFSGTAQAAVGDLVATLSVAGGEVPIIGA